MEKEIDTKQFVCWAFLEDYADTFARNFVINSKAAVSRSLPEKNLFLVGREVFFILFIATDERDYLQSVRNAFLKLILCTDQAYSILLRTFMMMAKDVIDCMLDRNGKLSSVENFMNRINEFSEILSDVYFTMSQEVPVKKPEIDLDSPEHREIVETFKQYLDEDRQDEQQSELKIHTYYRSVPVELDATVLKVDSRSVTFRVHPYEAVALSISGVATVKSALHLGVFQAFTNHVNVNARTATLSYFTPTDHPSELRATVRVAPSTIVKANLLSSKERLKCRIYDISEMAVALYARNAEPHLYMPGTPVRFITEIPSIYGKDPIPVNTDATITKIDEYLQGDIEAYRVIVHWEHNPHLNSLLSAYVSQRQIEIMQELNALSKE